MGYPSESGRPQRTRMGSRIASLSVMTLALLGLPLLGVAVQGKPLSRYLEFPPKTRYVAHAPFSWFAFWGFAVVTCGLVAPFVRRYLRARRTPGDKARPSRAFPWWGWLSLGFGLTAWILAWTRFSWFSAIQPHTFTPLWLSFILVVNALSWRRGGRCLMTHRTRFFLLLFPASAFFWWFFEYLNRFVQNWIYVGPDYSAWEYVLYATIPFSTVLPAVLSLREWIVSGPTFREAYSGFQARRWALSRGAALATFMIAAAGLAGVGIWPNHLFPLLWVSPLLMGVSIRTLFGEPHVLSTALEEGDWREAVSSALAALICGWFWEMWNFYSLSKWQYNIPLVDRFEIFEMPILGYAGYLPFGIACAFVADLLERVIGKKIR